VTDRNAVVEIVMDRLCEKLPGIDASALAVDRDLRDYAEFDSLGLLELLVWLEERFNIAIPDEELQVDRFSSVGKMADYVLAHS
jgi:acyl carrier protein